MSAASVWTGLQARYATVSGLKTVRLGDPTTIHDPPALHTALERVEREYGNQIVVVRYIFISRLYIRWQDNANAEAEVLSFLNAIPAAIDADRHLGGILSHGDTVIDEGTAGFVQAGGMLWRVVDFTVTATEKGPFKGGL